MGGPYLRFKLKCNFGRHIFMAPQTSDDARVHPMPGIRMSAPPKMEAEQNPGFMGIEIGEDSPPCVARDR